MEIKIKCRNYDAAVKLAKLANDTLINYRIVTLIEARGCFILILPKKTAKLLTANT